MAKKTSQKFPITTPSVIGSIVSIAINAVILYYLLGLEKKHCKCTLDHNHDALKLLTMINIGYPVLAVVLIAILTSIFKPSLASTLWFLIKLVYTGLLLGGAVILWRYVDKLNREDCQCAEKDMQNINSFLMIWRWVMVVLYGLSFLAMLYIGGNMLTN